MCRPRASAQFVVSCCFRCTAWRALCVQRSSSRSSRTNIPSAPPPTSESRKLKFASSPWPSPPPLARTLSLSPTSPPSFSPSASRARAHAHARHSRSRTATRRPQPPPLLPREMSCSWVCSALPCAALTCSCTLPTRDSHSSLWCKLPSCLLSLVFDDFSQIYRGNERLQ